MLFGRGKNQLIDAQGAIPGRAESLPVADRHTVLDTPLTGPWPDGIEVAVFGMGCFWGVERIFWRIPGVYSTAAGYAGGFTSNPTYEEVCSGLTGHSEVVLVAYDPAKVSYETLLKAFWENHDPTQGMGQGNDRGTQYRSAIYTTSAAEAAAATASLAAFQPVVTAHGLGQITTEIKPLGEFYYAEDYHQQYLSPSKNPNGYCNHGPNGMSCPIGIGAGAAQTTIEVPGTAH